MMKCSAHRRRAVLLTLCLLVGVIVAGGVSLWLRARQRQYTLNRQLITALLKGDDKQALALANVGADPNTRYQPAPVPSINEFVKRLFHRSVSPVNNSPTALMITCGALWKSDLKSVSAQAQRTDNAQLTQAMLTHGATVNTKDENGDTPLQWAVIWDRSKTARLLLEHHANVNAQDRNHIAVLHYAISEGRSTDVVGQLLAYGANPNLPDNQGETPLRAAQRVERPDVIALLKQFGARK